MSQEKIETKFDPKITSEIKSQEEAPDSSEGWQSEINKITTPLDTEVNPMFENANQNSEAETPEVLTNNSSGESRDLNNTAEKHFNTSVDWRSLSETEKFYLPVVLVGGPGTGKTSLIARIFQFSRLQLRNAKYESEYVPFPLNGAHDVKLVHDEANRIVTEVVAMLDGGYLTSATNQTDKFSNYIVPLKIKPSETSRLPNEATFAFIDGAGEEWKPTPVKANGIDNYAHGSKKLSPLIEGLLQNFEKPITFIYFCPTFVEHEQGDVQSSSEKKKIASQSIVNFIRNYQKVTRSFKVEDKNEEYLITDNHLILVTKWDRLFNPFGNDVEFNNFQRYDPKKVQKFLSSESNYAPVWEMLSNLGHDEIHRSSGLNVSMFAMSSMLFSRDVQEAILPHSQIRDERIKNALDYHCQKLVSILYENVHGVPLYTGSDWAVRKPSLKERLAKALSG